MITKLIIVADEIFKVSNADAGVTNNNEWNEIAAIWRDDKSYYIKGAGKNEKLLDCYNILRSKFYNFEIIERENKEVFPRIKFDEEAEFRIKLELANRVCLILENKENNFHHQIKNG